MPSHRLSDAMNIEPPAQNWIWTLDLALPSSNSNNDFIKSIYVQDVTVPFRSFDIKSRYRGGGHNFYPGDSSIDSININFYETEKFEILKFLLLWQNSIVDYSTDLSANAIGNYKMPAKYLTNMTASLFDGKDIYNPTLVVTMNGVWPAKIGDWQLNYHQSGNLLVSCTFPCNSVSVVFSESSSQAVLV